MMSNLVVSGSSESFASRDVILNNDQFSHVLSFFGPEELVLLEKVCTSWKTFIETTGQWKKHCQHRLNIPAHFDPSCFLPAGCSYKEGFRSGSSKVFDGKMYQYYLGADVGPVPPIPEEISLERADERDPCDPTQTIGRNYTWFYCPKDFTFEDPPFYLDKSDDPNDEEAPRVEQLAEKTRKKRVLTAPNTINNIGEIFKHPKNGNPSAYKYIWDEIADQLGNERAPSGWICMREDSIRRDLCTKQLEAVKNTGVVIPPLQHRILFNFLKHMDSGTYPDGRKSWAPARTSTRIRILNGNTESLGCGFDYHTGLLIEPSSLVCCHLGAAVVLPVKAHGIDS